jgi:hypothetical protein
LTSEKLARRQPSALTEFGHVLETFVINEVLKQIGWSDRRIDAGHLRTKDGVEVDLVLYLGNRSFTLEPGLHALPVDRLWTSIGAGG